MNPPIEIFQDGKGNLAELEVFEDDGPSVARLKQVGVKPVPETWGVDDIRFPSMQIPPDTLYDRFEGTTTECLQWIESNGFDISRTKHEKAKFDPMEAYDFEILEKLRAQLDVITVLPATILTFALMRLRRYKSERDKTREALTLAIASLEELVADPETDFGPAYEGAKTRQKEAIKAGKAALKIKELKDLVKK